MCGIFCYNGRVYTLEELQKAFEVLRHRGPDHTYAPHEIADQLYIGFHRLSINGLDSGSNQPLWLGEELALICNGEIYNHRELAEKYQIKLTTHSDCEIILHLYQKIGLEPLLRELESESAFILYDKDKQLLCLARDPIGIRPMFQGFNTVAGCRAWSSEAKVLYKLGLPEISPFPPGSYQTIKLGEPYSSPPQRYYHLPTDTLALPKSDELLEKVRDLVVEAIKIRVEMADRPVGVFLSGGVDSSIVAAVASKFHPKLRSFAIGLLGAPDLAPARLAAEKIGTQHTEVNFTVAEGLSTLETLIYQLESPDVTTIRASMGMYLLSKYIKENTDITVILSGEGPDEVFSGYLYNHQAPSPAELHQEALRRVTDLYLFDVLRCDRSTAAHSLEVRVPFLSRKIVDYVLSLPPETRDPKHNKNIEKHLLRAAFQGWLPDSILWRPKEAFSDGVGYGWVAGLKELAERTVEMARWEQRAILYPQSTPSTKEAFMYREIYQRLFGNHALLVPYTWLPNWSDGITDPSATALQIHKQRITTGDKRL